MKDITHDGYKNLAIAIIRLAKHDYKESYYKYSDGKSSLRKLKKEREVFYSKWFKLLYACLDCYMEDDDIDKVIERWEEQWEERRQKTI